MRRSLVALGVVLGAAGALVSASASAFCRTWTCDPSGGHCQPDPANPKCLGADPTANPPNLPLFWPVPCVGFSLNSRASAQLDPDRAKAFGKFQAVAEQAFATWQGVRCGGLSPSIAYSDLGAVECGAHEYNTNQGNANILVFREAVWPYTGVANTLALTTLTFNVDSGEIYDADMEINATPTVHLTLGDNNVADDLLSIMTHEAGHFIGIAHSPDPHATMFATYQPGSTSIRVLSPDDEAAICAIYPPDRTGLPTCDPTPRHGYATLCGEPYPNPRDTPECTASLNSRSDMNCTKPQDLPPPKGCSVARAGEAGSPGGLAGLVLLACASLVGRRRGRGARGG